MVDKGSTAVASHVEKDSMLEAEREAKLKEAFHGDEKAREWAKIIGSWSAEERAAKEKAYVRHIDRRIMPMLMACYVLNYIDRNALPQARIQGLEKDLGLHGVQYNTILSLLFVGYISLQVPSNMILGIVKPSIYLPLCMAVWGVISGCTGAIHNFGGAAACRFFLGMAEAPFFAGVAFLFSGWYTKRELGKRLGIFFTAAMLSGAFGGLFAAGIRAAFQGYHLESWRMLFIIEGAATVAVSIAAIFVIPNWPSTTKWLSEEERYLGVTRMLEDAGEEDEDVSPLEGLKLAAKDYRLWLVILGQMCVQTIASLTNFLPTLVKNFGFSTIHTLLLTAPPYIAAALFCVYNTWHSDKRNERSSHLIFPISACMVGIIITMSTTNIAARYFSLFLMLPGAYGCFQISNAWCASVCPRPRQKRSIALAMNNSFGNLSLVFSPYLYPPSAGPKYTTAWSVNLSLGVLMIVATIVLRLLLQKQNKRLDELEASGAAAEEGVVGDHVDHAGRSLGGNNSGATYRYQT